MSNRRSRSDLNNITFNHPAARLLKIYKNRGVPVRLSSKPWSKQRLDQAIARGAHPSCLPFHDFLHEEFVDMIDKGQWVILPYSLAKSLPGLRLSPPGVVPQRDRRPRWICDLSFYGINDDTLPIVPPEAMQFGHALDRYLREILLADPELGPIYMLKLDIADGFYRIALNIDDIPKLGVVFPTNPGEEPLVALPLVLPMGWKNSPPAFCVATETAADLANNAINSDAQPNPHPLNAHAAALDDSPSTPTAPAPFPTAAPSITTALPPPLPPATTHANTSVTPISTPTPVPTTRDPCLPSSKVPVSYVDVFMDDFLALAQGQQNRQRVRQLLFHAVDTVFRPNDFHDQISRREPVSLKKLRQGDCSWSTIKTVLGWIINTAAMTLQLPPHRQDRLGQILASIPPSQKRTSVKKWHKLLGELRSMSLALPGARNVFSAMQNALVLSSSNRIALRKGVHQALADFQWMADDISQRPTRIAELVPLQPAILGFHDASGLGAGGVAYPTPDVPPRVGVAHNQPILFRVQWPQEIRSRLITDSNPNGSITNSDLELAGGLLQLQATAQSYDVRERTINNKTDNLATMFWQRKGSASTEKAPAHLLRLHGIHQRIHRYISRHDYMPGPSNPMADDASRLFHLSDTDFLAYFNSKYPQKQPYKLVTIPLQVLSCVISALLRKPCSAASLTVEPPPATAIGKSGQIIPTKWASTPYSKPSKTKYPSFKSSSTEFDLAMLQPARIRSGLAQLKSTYGLLPRRTSPWGPQTYA